MVILLSQDLIQFRASVGSLDICPASGKVPRLKRQTFRFALRELQREGKLERSEE